MKIIFCIYLFYYCLGKSEQFNKKDAELYLLRYGYVDGFDKPAEITNGLKRLQHFANLRVTGEFDAATVKQMQLPRCGLQDPQIKVTRSRRYTHQGTTWSKSRLTWRLEGRGRTLDQNTIRRIMHKAFAFWSDVTNVDFVEKSGAEEPDIWVKFVRYSHGDPYSFDGQGGTLAHAFYPHNNEGLSGDVHFDDDEDYTAESAEGRNLLWVATHEIGHSIGLEHSSVREAVMYPWYTKYKPGFTLHHDDIVGIQSLYGSRRKEPKTEATTTKPKTTQTPKPKTAQTPKPKTTKTAKTRPCPVGGVAAFYYDSTSKRNILMTDNDKMYFIKKEGGIHYGPVKTSNYIPKSRIPNQIDAAFSTKLNSNDVTVYFSGDSYYVFKYFRYKSGPHSIHGNKQDDYDKNPLKLTFPTWVSKIDAVMTWHRNKRTYFFAGESYWRYNNKVREFDRGYPRKIQNAWRGLPKKIDAVYSSDELKTTFFISGDQYYKLNDRYVRVAQNYPVHIGKEWLKCGQHSSSAGLPIGSIGSVAVDNTDEESAEEP